MSATPSKSRKQASVSVALDILTVTDTRKGDFEFAARMDQTRDAVRAGGVLKQSAFWNGAILLHYATASKMIGKSDEATWATQGAFAADLQFADSTGTLLKTLGRAIVDFKVTYGSKVWLFLADKGTNGRVSEVVRKSEDKATFDAGIKALMSELAETGSLPGKKRAAGGEANQTQKDKPDEPKAPVKPLPSDVLVMLHEAQTITHGFTASDWTDTIRPALVKWIESEDGRQAKIAARTARKSAKATPADMPTRKAASGE